jgi:hypothetical protein
MALITIACVAALVAINAARDGSEPPRVRTRAEAALRENPVATAAAAHPAPSPPVRNDAPAGTAAAAPPDITDLERRLATSDPGARDLVLQELLPTLFAQDPERTARFAELQSDPTLRELAIRQVALLWGAKDSERAINWARTLPDAAERDATIADIANGLSSVDPARSVQLLEQFVGTAETDHVLSNLVQQWAGFDFDAALAWTEARAPGAQRDDLLQRLVYVRAASGDPAAAARLVNASSLSGEAKTAAIASIAQEWALNNPAATREWLQTLDRDSSRAAMADLGAGAGSAP